MTSESEARRVRGCFGGEDRVVHPDGAVQGRGAEAAAGGGGAGVGVAWRGAVERGGTVRVDVVW